MATYEDRLRQYKEVDEPAAFKAHVAAGIRKKFADEFDFGDMPDQEVIQRHYARFGADMVPADYATKLKEVYGKDYTPPPAPKENVGDRVAQVGEIAKETAKGIVPFVVPAAVEGAAAAAKVAPTVLKAVGTKIPGVGALASAGGHAINALTEQATASKLQATAAALAPVDVETKSQEFYAKLLPGLSAKGYTPEQVMQEARSRAQGIAEGQRKTTESIEQDVARTQEEAALEPVKAATDAFFFGVGGPQIVGALQSGLRKVGLSSAATALGEPTTKAVGGALNRVASHIKTGVAIGIPGMALQEGATHAVQSASENKTPAEIAQDLVSGVKSGVKHGFIGGAVLGAFAGGAEEALGAALRPGLQRKRMREYVKTRDIDRAEEAKRNYDADVLAKSAASFDPRTTKYPITGDPAEVATTIVQTEHGDASAMSEAGLRAASTIEERIRLFQDANTEATSFGQRELPPATTPEVAPAGLTRGPQPEPTLGPAPRPSLGRPLGAIEQGGRVPAAEEIHPLAGAAPVPATEPTAAPRPSASAVEFGPTGASEFRKAAKKALETIPRAAGSLAVHPPTYYTKPGVETYLSADKKTGYALVPRAEGGKELVSAFNMGEKGLGLSAVRQAVERGATHLDAIKPLEHLYEKAGFVTTRTEPNYVKGQPDVVYMEIPGAVPVPSAAAEAIRASGISEHDPEVRLSEENGAIHLERVGVPTAENLRSAIESVSKTADERQVPIVTRIVKVPGPKGGMIPVEKLLPWYEKHGFKLTENTKLPEGQMATATLRREPKPPPAMKIGMLDAQKRLYERAIQKPETPAEENLAAPAATPGPGRPHQLDLWADANITAARERIRQREAEYPSDLRSKARESGSVGQRSEGYRDPTSYDWADFADSIQIGVNVLLKQGLNKTAWVESMVRELGGKFRAVAEKVYQEALAAYNARRPRGIDEVRQVVDDYAHQAGLGRGATRHDYYPEMDPKFGARVATAYQRLDNATEGTPAWNEVAQSYEALNHEIALQYEAMKKAGYTIEHTNEDPYPTSADMRRDVVENKHIKAFKTPESANHPFMTPEQNDKFRAVHDFFGHAAEGYEFGARGEDAAFRKHASTLSSKAIPALTTETRGQNSWVNFHVPEPKKFSSPDTPENIAKLEKAVLGDMEYTHDAIETAGFITPGGKLVDIGETMHDQGAAGAFKKASLKVPGGKSVDEPLSRLLDDGFVRVINQGHQLNIEINRPLNEGQRTALEVLVRSAPRRTVWYDFNPSETPSENTSGKARSLEDLLKAHDRFYSLVSHQDLLPNERPFAEQKFGLLPRWTYEDVLARETRAPANRLSAGIVSRGIRGDERAVTSAAKTLARGVRPVKSPAGVRARFTADGNAAVNEMMSVSPESATWYHDDIKKMHDLTRAEIPALKDPGHEALFDLLLGFTSPNTNVPQNYARAFSLMRDFERSGRVPFLQRFGQEVNIGSRNWVPRLNALIERHGGDLEAMRDYLLTKDPKTGVYNVEKEFGDKVGPFTLNIQGIHDPITVDVWMVRRLRRIAGTLNREGKLNEDWVPSAQERRDIEESIREIGKQTGLDHDAVQAVLWDNEKMIWERAGLAAPRIPFSVAAERVLKNVHERHGQIEKGQAQQGLFEGTAGADFKE